MIAAVMYRLNLYRDGKMTSTELIEARTVQVANELARQAVKADRAAEAEVQYISGGIAFRARPKPSP